MSTYALDQGYRRLRLTSAWGQHQTFPERRGKGSVAGRPVATTTERCASHPSAQNSTVEPTGSLPLTIEFPRFALSTKIQTSSGPPPVDPLIAHDQADPGAHDLWIGQIDILPNQPRALAMCINQPSTRSITPVE